MAVSNQPLIHISSSSEPQCYTRRHKAEASQQARRSKYRRRRGGSLQAFRHLSKRRNCRVLARSFMFPCSRDTRHVTSEPASHRHSCSCRRWRRRVSRNKHRTNDKRSAAYSCKMKPSNRDGGYARLMKGVDRDRLALVSWKAD